MDEIFRRGTCRYFKEKMPVPDDELLTLVKAGMQARAVGNQKSRDFIIVTREDLVKAISHNSIIAVGYADRAPVRMNRYDPDAVFLDLYGSHKKTVYTGK